MAEARKCDICGRLFEPLHGCDDLDMIWFDNRRIRTSGIYFESKRDPTLYKDCCPACMVVFQSLLSVLSLDISDEKRSEIVTDILEYAEKLKEV